jgi:hypothetical protein
MVKDFAHRAWPSGDYNRRNLSIRVYNENQLAAYRPLPPVPGFDWKVLDSIVLRACHLASPRQIIIRQNIFRESIPERCGTSTIRIAFHLSTSDDSGVLNVSFLSHALHEKTIMGMDHFEAADLHLGANFPGPRIVAYITGIELSDSNADPDEHGIRI